MEVDLGGLLHLLHLGPFGEFLSTHAEHSADVTEGVLLRKSLVQQDQTDTYVSPWMRAMSVL